MLTKTRDVKLHILNYGFGVESTAILLRWIYDTTSRPFKSWNELIILGAQTGDEYWETKYLCETFIFPLLRALGVRVVQVAKHGPFREDGYTVLSDTTEPYTLHIEGDHKLSDNMLMDGWSVRVNRPHICAMRWKGEVLDAWILDHAAEGFGPYLGYNRDELGRMKDAQDYGCHGQRYIFPLIEWNWSRDDCLEYIFRLLGVLWHKSCCVFCPFQTHKTAIMHYRANPKAAEFALWCEFNAMTPNPRMKLFERYGMVDVCQEAGLDQAIANFEQRQQTCEWSFYRVRRIYRMVGKPDELRLDSARNLECLATGTQSEMNAQLLALANERGTEPIMDSHLRLYSHLRPENVYPALEGFWVVGPSGINDKCFRERFNIDWRKLIHKPQTKPNTKDTKKRRQKV